MLRPAARTLNTKMASILHRIKNKLVTEYQRSQYMKVASAVLQTPPLERGDAPFMALSMVHKRDVISYLVAVKSFARFERPSHITVVCDPSIDDDDRATFKRHIPFVELRQAEEFRHVQIPQGGCWERLSAITEYTRDHYVVQLDADTLSVAPLAEVRQAVQTQCGFVLGERADQPLLTLAQAAANARDWSSQHIQSVCEKRMNTAGLTGQLYVRGCAGFTGFPSDAGMQEKMFDFSTHMSAVVEGRWAEWGTEQVTSNYLVANARDTKVLPYPRYSTPETHIDDIAFFHFIGYVRFVNSLYRAKTKQALGLIAQPS